MKLKYGLLILALGYCLEFVGAWMKITHWAYADDIFLLATLLKIGATVFVVIKLVSHPKLKEFMNN